MCAARRIEHRYRVPAIDPQVLAESHDQWKERRKDNRSVNDHVLAVRARVPSSSEHDHAVAIHPSANADRRLREVRLRFEGAQPESARERHHRARRSPTNPRSLRQVRNEIVGDEDLRRHRVDRCRGESHLHAVALHRVKHGAGHNPERRLRKALPAAAEELSSHHQCRADSPRRQNRGRDDHPEATPSAKLVRLGRRVAGGGRHRSGIRCLVRRARDGRTRPRLPGAPCDRARCPRP